jgi:oxalate decarboxylase/phosphoglucose isomerase-like protein (cupin superfamily)
MSLEDCREIELPKIHDPRGNLTFIESGIHVPFEIKRVYYLYDVPGGATRAGHAHKKLQQVLVAIAGSFDVLLDDGKKRELHHLNRSYCGLYIYPLTWRVIDNFSSGAVCLSIVSAFYDESDYFRDYDKFLHAIGEQPR